MKDDHGTASRRCRPTKVKTLDARLTTRGAARRDAPADGNDCLVAGVQAPDHRPTPTTTTDVDCAGSPRSPDRRWPRRCRTITVTHGDPDPARSRRRPHGPAKTSRPSSSRTRVEVGGKDVRRRDRHRLRGNPSRASEPTISGGEGGIVGPAEKSNPVARRQRASTRTTGTLPRARSTIPACGDMWTVPETTRTGARRRGQRLWLLDRPAPTTTASASSRCRPRDDDDTATDAARGTHTINIAQLPTAEQTAQDKSTRLRSRSRSPARRRASRPTLPSGSTRAAERDHDHGHRLRRRGRPRGRDHERQGPQCSTVAASSRARPPRTKADDQGRVVRSSPSVAPSREGR